MRLIALDCVAIYPQGYGRVSVPKSRGYVGYGNTRPKQQRGVRVSKLMHVNFETAYLCRRGSGETSNANDDRFQPRPPPEHTVSAP